jgi:hypothetical protein
MPEVYKYPVNWRFEAGEISQDIPDSYFSSDDPLGIVLPDMTTGVEELQSVLSHLGEHGIKAAGVLPPYLRPNEYPGLSIDDSISGTLGGFLPAVQRDINKRAGRPEDQPLEFLAASSKGAGEATLATFLAHQAGIQLTKKVVAVSTVGVLSRHYDNDPAMRYLEFKRRMKTSDAKYEPNQALDYARYMDMRHMPSILRHALERDDGPDVIKELINSGYSFSFYIGRDDLICSPKEARRQLGRSLKHIIHDIDGHHAPLTSDRGRSQLVEAIQGAISMNGKSPFNGRRHS